MSTTIKKYLVVGATLLGYVAVGLATWNIAEKTLLDRFVNNITDVCYHGARMHGSNDRWIICFPAEAPDGYVEPVKPDTKNTT